MHASRCSTPRGPGKWRCGAKTSATSNTSRRVSIPASAQAIATTTRRGPTARRSPIGGESSELARDDPSSPASWPYPSSVLQLELDRHDRPHCCRYAVVRAWLHAPGARFTHSGLIEPDETARALDLDRAHPAARQDLHPPPKRSLVPDA